jgi:hypothetical protein
MKLANDAEYRRALDRANALRAEGASVESERELAELDAAISKYEAQGEGLGGETKGRPGGR